MTRGTWIVGDERAVLRGQVAAQYAMGQTIRQIAAQLGRSYGCVHRLLGEAGVTFRPRGGRKRQPTSNRLGEIPMVTPEQRIVATHLLDDLDAAIATLPPECRPLDPDMCGHPEDGRKRFGDDVRCLDCGRLLSTTS
jgi:hypothetical protein